MSQRVTHFEQCPECAAVGGDTRQDNLAVYDDGHKHCYACGYHVFANCPIPTTPQDRQLITFPKLTSVLSEWPLENLIWLRQYLSDEEIEGFFEYAPSLDRHVFTLDWTENGEQFRFMEARSVNKTPKSIQAGTKPFFPIYKFTDSDDELIDSTLVIVEDIVSAIVVGRQFNALPLFGSSCRGSWITRIARDKFFKRVIVWLDNDKTKEALELTRKISILKPSSLIVTENDPKLCTDEEIKTFVMEPGYYLPYTAKPVYHI